MGHGHDHHHRATGTRLGWALGATLAFVIGEGWVGWRTGSLALVSDAGHNLADGLALGLSWYAHTLSTRAADARRTYGYHRVGVLAALMNAVLLVLIAGGILWQAYVRVRAPVLVPGGLVMATAGVALGLNLLISWWLSRSDAHDVNLRSAYLHMLGDAAASAGVIIAGAIILITRWSPADAIASAIIAALILWSSWSILVETVTILLEAAPGGLDMDEVGKAIGAVPGVLGVHDLHAWTLGSGIIACSCHILVAEQAASSGQDVQRLVGEALRRFRISHSTIQLEVTPCTVGPDGLYCVGAGAENESSHHTGGHGHDHHHGHGPAPGHHHGHEHGHGGHDHGHDQRPAPSRPLAPPGQRRVDVQVPLKPPTPPAS